MRLFELNDISFNEKIEIIKKNCSEILTIYKSSYPNVLWRGMNLLPFKKHEIKTRNNPVFFPKNYHELLHDALLELDYKATRKNSIFTSGNYDIAASWGEPQIVFPTNGFKYTWFSAVKKQDYVISYLIDILEETLLHINKENIFNLNELNEDDRNNFLFDINQKLENLGIDDSALEIAIEEQKEVLITGKSYYVLPENDYENLLNYLNK